MTDDDKLDRIERKLCQMAEELDLEVKYYEDVRFTHEEILKALKEVYPERFV